MDRDPRDMAKEELDATIVLYEYDREEFRDIAISVLGKRFKESLFEADWQEFLRLKREKALH